MKLKKISTKLAENRLIFVLLFTIFLPLLGYSYSNRIANHVNYSLLKTGLNERLSIIVGHRLLNSDNEGLKLLIYYLESTDWDIRRLEQLQLYDSEKILNEKYLPYLVESYNAEKHPQLKSMIMRSFQTDCESWSEVQKNALRLLIRGQKAEVDEELFLPISQLLFLDSDPDMIELVRLYQKAGEPLEYLILALISYQEATQSSSEESLRNRILRALISPDAGQKKFNKLLENQFISGKIKKFLKETSDLDLIERLISQLMCSRVGLTCLAQISSENAQKWFSISQV